MSIKSHRSLILCLGLLGALRVLAGCGGGSSGGSRGEGAVSSPTRSGAPPAVSGDAWQGRYVGTVTIGGVQYFGDALLTADGAIRLYVGGPYADDGTLQMSVPAGSAQLVGTLRAQADQLVGTAVIFGQDCAAAPASRFCRQMGRGEISVAFVSGSIQGDIAVATDDGAETWSLDLGNWNNYYVLPAVTAYLAGHYQETLAEFTLDGDTIVSIDANGALSLQSANSGCTGNGTLRPHLDGAVNVYDVSLVIESCIAPYDYLNSTYTGLATTSPSSYWDYDTVLRMWLSRPDPDGSSSAPQAALMMSGEPL